MAGFKSAPASGGKDDRDPVRILAIGDLINRDDTGAGTPRADKDQHFYNGVFEVAKNAITGKVTSFFTKRPGIHSSAAFTTTSGTARGCFFWRQTQSVYSAVGTKLFINGTDTGVTLSSSANSCGFAVTHPSATNQYICVNDGVKLFCINPSNSVTTVTINFPTPNTGDLVYLDRYMFVAKSDGTIWHCELDDPITWNTTKFITAQSYASPLITMARLGKYLFAFTNDSMQAFYNNANASGSVLNNEEQLTRKVGATSKRTMISASQSLVWIGSNDKGAQTVFQMGGDGNIEEAATPFIQKIINAQFDGTSTDPSFLGSCFSFPLLGKPLFVFTGASGPSLVYDNTLNIWYYWTAASSIITKWPIHSIASITSSLYVGQHLTDGNIYIIDSSTYQDIGSSFTVECQFSKFDGDTTKRKFCRDVEIVGDIQINPTSTLLTYSDNDGITFSSARTINMASNRPSANRLGYFFRRIFRLSYTGTGPWRIQALDLYLSKGTD